MLRMLQARTQTQQARNNKVVGITREFGEGGGREQGYGVGVEEGEEHWQKDENPNDYAARANDTTRLCVLLMLSRLGRD